MFFLKKKPTTYEYLLVGLGNPGNKYTFTRHNAGFLFTEALEEKHGFKVNKLKFHSLCGEVKIGTHRCLVMRPQTMMNNSGEAVKEAASFYKIPPENIIVIFDDISLEPGKLRIRRNGSAGGHNGIKSIIAHLSTENFPRIKLGVGKKPNPEYDLADWVLSKMSNNELKLLREAVDKAIDSLIYMLDGKIEEAMNNCN